MEAGVPSGHETRDVYTGLGWEDSVVIQEADPLLYEAYKVRCVLCRHLVRAKSVKKDSQNQRVSTSRNERA